MSKVLIIGDVHEEFDKLNRLINKRKPEVVIACGDFGLWDLRLFKDWIKPQGAKIYFCDGNHENYDIIKKLLKGAEGIKKPIEVVKDIYYMPRGTVISLNGFKILFIGGAESTDKEYRTEGIDWFPEESITTDDINNLPEGKIDIVISHCAPDFVRDAIGFEEKKWGNSPTLLGYVHEQYHPARWYFGHYHYEYKSMLQGTLFQGLHMLHEGGCWIWLPDKPESNDG